MAGNKPIHNSTARYSQVLNPATGHFLKRDVESGRFVAIKSDGQPFEGIPLEKSYVRTNPSIKKSTAKKAELAVMKVKSNKAA